MRLFKNRGDFYIPKTDKETGREERILRILLVFIIIFTVAFVALLSQRYSSVSDFFGRGEVTVTDIENESEENLPQISGKTNFLFLETDDAKSTLHYMFLIQADRDTKAYKVCALSPQSDIDGESLLDIYLAGGGAALQTRLTEYLGFEIDYYAAFETSDFIEFSSKLGSFVYPSNREIRFSGGEGDDKYTIHINEGEQNINGKELSNILRYYCEEKKSYEEQNEALLYALTQLFNEDNYEDCDRLFRLFIQSSSTNITVRDFENAKDALLVFCKHNNDITVYRIDVSYENNVLSQSTVKNMKGYFSK